MPRNVKNFWITANVDGRVQPVIAGPRARDGGFDLTIEQRDAGDITMPVKISGIAHSDGKTLRLFIDVEGHDRITVETRR